MHSAFAPTSRMSAPRPVTAVLNAGGKVIENYPKDCEQLLPQPAADAVNDILRGVQEPGGFGYTAGINTAQPSAGKTGTIRP